MDYTLEDFLSAVLLDEMTEDTNYVFCVQNKPIDDKQIPWFALHETELLPNMRRSGSEFSAYMSTSIVNRDKTTGRFKNRQSLFAGLNMVVLDDIGTKVNPNALKPTYKIETSAGNFQWGYVFQDPITDFDIAERLVRAVYETDLTDGGGNMINKFVRIPAGINNKLRDTGLDTFQVRLVELNDDTYYTMDELLDGFGVELAAPRTKKKASVMIDDSGMPPRDPMLAWLGERGLVVNDSGDPWVTIECPWGNLHSGDTHAHYAPLGRGGEQWEDVRNFECKHDHCSERRYHDFNEWAKERNAPESPAFDPIARLRSQYTYLKYSNEVADVTVGALYKYPVIALSHFKNANRRYFRGDAGRNYYGDLWLEDSRTVICDGRTYEPEAPMIIRDTRKGVLLNTYRTPEHVNVGGLPSVYLDHIEWLIPDEEERAIFHLWIAQKLQKPLTRSYAMVLVADLMEGEAGEKFGTGRSVVGDIFKRVFQAGVSSVELSDINGKGGSQSAYNDWVAETQLCVIEETKDSADSYRDDFQSYEKIKQVVDSRPIPDQRIKPKYGRIYTATIYANFLFFSNHSNAIQLPEGDRRFMVIDNNKGRRSLAEYRELYDFLNSDVDIGRLYWWYMGLDISNFDQVYPPMTPAKKRMTQQSMTTVDEIWGDCLNSFDGGLVSQKMLVERCLLFVEPGDELVSKIPSVVRAKWKKLENLGNEYKINLNGKNHRVRVIKNNEEIRDRYSKTDYDFLRSQLDRNLNPKKYITES